MTLLGDYKMVENKDFYEGWIKDDEVWRKRLLELDKFGKVDKLSGEFIFKLCNICNGPWIAHENVDDENLCDKV